jgi:hypothetical protein
MPRLDIICYPLTGFSAMLHVLLVFMQVLNSFMVFNMTSFMLAILMMVVLMTSSLMLFKMMNHVLMLMLMGSFTVFVNSGMIVFHI